MTETQAITQKNLNTESCVVMPRIQGSELHWRSREQRTRPYVLQFRRLVYTDGASCFTISRRKTSAAKRCLLTNIQQQLVRTSTTLGTSHCSPRMLSPRPSKNPPRRMNSSRCACLTPTVWLGSRTRKDGSRYQNQCSAIGHQYRSLYHWQKLSIRRIQENQQKCKVK